MTETEVAARAWPMPRSCPMLPPDEYAELRKSPPQRVRLDDGTLVWIVSRYEDVRDAMASSALSMDITQPGFPMRLPIPPVPRVQSFIRMDPPEHTRLRRMVMPELTPAAVKTFVPWMTEIIDGLLDDMEKQPRPVDLVSQFAFPLPSLTISRVLGVPGKDASLFQQHTRALTAINASAEDAQKSFAALFDYLGELVHAKEAEPGDDMISRLVTRYVASGELAVSDLVAMVFLVLVAGHETAGNQIALTTLMLLRHPEQKEKMLNEPGYVDKIVDESLRYWSIPQDNTVRVVIKDTELGGVPVKAGEGVMLAISAGNHDESVFPGAHEFRPERDPHNHLSFGQGIHYCPGAVMAKVEMGIALPALFRRFPNLRSVVDFDDLTFRHTMAIYGLTEFLLTW